MERKDITAKVERARERFSAVRTQKQLQALEDWVKERPGVFNQNYGVYWSSKHQGTVLSAIYLKQSNVRVPFDENSSMEDVQKFIDLLKVAEVHEG